MVKMDTQDYEQKPAQVYLLHFEQPYWSKAQHYVGYTTIGADSRIEKHRTGKGSLLVNYAHNKKGIPFQVALVEDFETAQLARHFERKLKNEGHLSRHCPICRGEHG
ncbi:MAG: endonuclease [Candidatus Portnoybacteria bacterium]|jgi:predicted GIY-YIG superfamily endonuclease|nr:endonuclease [Candidatus Portnoybacteria bacterium]